MSSVLNHVPCHLGLPALRAARPLYCSGHRQKCFPGFTSASLPATIYDKKRLSTSFNYERSAKSNGTNDENPIIDTPSYAWWRDSRPKSTSTTVDHYSVDSRHSLLDDGRLRAQQQRPTEPGNNHGSHNQARRPDTTHAQKKHWGQTPSEILIAALESTGQKVDLGQPPRWTTDLSWVSPDKPHSATQKRKDRATKTAKNPPRVSFQTIVAEYITNVDPLIQQMGIPTMDEQIELPSRMNEMLLETFNQKHLAYLDARGYSPVDVMAWAWILKSECSYEAALRLFALEESYRRQRSASPKRVPPFIPLFLLRQRLLDLKSYRLLLSYSLHLMSGCPLPTVQTALRGSSIAADANTQHEPQRLTSQLDPTMCMTFVVRLLRHARQVWPSAQLSVARAFASFLTTIGVDGKSDDAIQRLNTFRANKFNTCLWLLSLPSKVNPFASASVQQRAQFELLKAMASHHPVLPVTRRGYQGIVAVQVAHKKTPAERLSADLKAPSWPPWKEEKLGMDTSRGNEGMKSRAIHVMAQMKEAGYSHSRWEEVAAILAGWDTDRSPTIQTRALMPRPYVLRGPQGNNPDHPAIWTARIRATRTVREAWACFLTYHEQGFRPHKSVYFAMAHKLVFRTRAIENDFEQCSLALPGDGPEVFSEPSSSRDVIYVHTEPPTLDDFLKKMVSDGVRPSGRFFAMLLESAASFTSGMNYIRFSDLSEKQVEALCTVWPAETDYDNSRVVGKLPDYLFSSFIRFLCKFSSFDPLYRAKREFRTSDLFPIVMRNSRLLRQPTSLVSYDSTPEEDHIHHPRTLAHAVHLIKAYKPKHPPAWIALLSALSRDRISIRYHNMDQTVQRILAWHEVLEISEQAKRSDVELGTHGFHVLCASFAKAVAAGIKHPQATEEALEIIQQQGRYGDASLSLPVCKTFEQIVYSGLDILKRRFDRIVLPGSTSTSIDAKGADHGDRYESPSVKTPAMLQVPNPAVLHAFVRALGVSEDYDGLLDLLRWMSRSAPILKDTSDELLNGERMMRRTLVAVRVFLEGYWDQGFSITAHRGDYSVISEPAGDRFDVGVRPSLFHEDRQLEFSDAYVQEAHDIIEQTELWGGWPTEDEVREYLLWDPSPHGKQH
ncbi:conserved hypothetical protein [Paecilomyces variotii No. 5]|uniref:Mitochondrial ATPase expression-domain-containing protein n=1 Tax=Byssochlamys spectabilis (strain No. 5 / NBRC 109023) TaxID=1356009 RepID=V5FDD4_BYSSN|nr:conserved hypothetical protein [Paecilomyces variotii No. 5]